MATIQIFQVTDAAIRAKGMSWSGDIYSYPEDYEQVGEVEVHGEEEAHCGTAKKPSRNRAFQLYRAYNATQNATGSWHLEGKRSTMVGDIFRTLQGEKWRVEPQGYKRVYAANLWGKLALWMNLPEWTFETTAADPDADFSNSWNLRGFSNDTDEELVFDFLDFFDLRCVGLIQTHVRLVSGKAERSTHHVNTNFDSVEKLLTKKWFRVWVRQIFRANCNPPRI
tara:strand:- start:161 stop:832 length:672 start_codon:yes stop_codon:yes gene_type:complete